MKHTLIALVAFLFIATSAHAGTIPFDGANFFCPDNTSQPCCDKIIYDADQRAGADLGETVMECDPGEGFFLKLPVPAEATPNLATNTLAFLNFGHGTSNTDTGQICYGVSHTVLDLGTGNTPQDVLNFTFGGAAIMYDTSSTASASTQFREKRSQGADNNVFIMWNGRTDAVCANVIECINDFMVLRFAALNGPSGGCTDPLSGKTFVAGGVFGF